MTTLFNRIRASASIGSDGLIVLGDPTTNFSLPPEWPDMPDGDYTYLLESTALMEFGTFRFVDGIQQPRSVVSGAANFMPDTYDLTFSMPITAANGVACGDATEGPSAHDDNMAAGAFAKVLVGSQGSAAIGTRASANGEACTSLGYRAMAGAPGEVGEASSSHVSASQPLYMNKTSNVSSFLRPFHGAVGIIVGPGGPGGPGGPVRGATAIGCEAHASGLMSTAVGVGASCRRGLSTAVGAQAEVRGFAGIAIGNRATTQGALSVAIGQGAIARYSGEWCEAIPMMFSTSTIGVFWAGAVAESATTLNTIDGEAVAITVMGDTGSSDPAGPSTLVDVSVDIRIWDEANATNATYLKIIRAGCILSRPPGGEPAQVVKETPVEVVYAGANAPDAYIALDLQSAGYVLHTTSASRLQASGTITARVSSWGVNLAVLSAQLDNV